MQLGLDRVEDFEKLDEAAEVRTYPFASYPSTTPIIAYIPGAVPVILLIQPPFIQIA